MGSGAPRLSRADRAGAALAFATALAPVAALWGFTVDDAFIPARYAHHLATGAGYTFNRGQPSTDGVTPLGFAHLLSPFAADGALGAFEAARWSGVLAVLAAMALLGVALGRALAGGGRRRAVGCAVALVLSSAPLGAWSGAGLETGWVIALVGSGLALQRLSTPRGASLAFGLGAALRPELAPFALVQALSPPRPRSAVEHGLRAALAALPFVAVALTRTWAFGRPIPLSAIAKAPEPLHGLYYAAACALLAGPAALCAPLVASGLSGRDHDELGRSRAPSEALARGRWIVLAVATHLVAVAFAGGDWMPLSRLVAPIVPAIAVGASELAVALEGRALVVHVVRVALAVAAQLWVAIGIGPRAREVLDDRLALLRELAPALADRRVVATIDVGWVGVAAPHATVVDLAGVTDPVVAAMPGGHTQKRLPDPFLTERRVDALVLLLAREAELVEPWTASRFDRGAERWIALAPGQGERFEPRALGRGRLRYAVLTARQERLADAAARR